MEYFIIVVDGHVNDYYEGNCDGIIIEDDIKKLKELADYFISKGFDVAFRNANRGNVDE